MFDLDDSDESEQLLESVMRTSKEIQTKVRNVEDSIDQLRAVTGPYTELANNFRKLAERDQQHRKTITQLRTQNQALQADKNGVVESLAKATSEYKRIEKLLNTTESEKTNLQTQVHTMILEREALMKSQADASKLIRDMQQGHHDLNSKINELKSDVRAKIDCIAELELRMRNEKDEFRMIIEQNEKEAAKRREDMRAELMRQHNQRLEAKSQECDASLRRMKNTFESALKEAELETKKLAAERNEWFAKYKQLASELEEKKRRLNADTQRLLSEKWRELMSSFNHNQASQNLRNDEFLMIRRPENLASKFMDELIGSSPSESSVFARNQNEAVLENSENVPPHVKPPRKRTAGDGPRLSVRDVAGKVVSSHANPTTFRGNTQQQKQAKSNRN